MKIDITVLVIYIFGQTLFACNAVLQGSVNKTLRPVGEELNTLHKNIKDIEEDLQHVKKRLNFTITYGASEKKEDIDRTRGQYATEETIHQGKGRKEDVAGGEEKTKPLKEGVRKVAKAACQCVCFVSKTVSNLVKTCYGKLRSLCCKRKELNTTKQDVRSHRESLDFGLY